MRSVEQAELLKAFSTILRYMTDGNHSEMDAELKLDIGVAVTMHIELIDFQEKEGEQP
jgi:hypothetical protein